MKYYDRCDCHNPSPIVVCCGPGSNQPSDPTGTGEHEVPSNVPTPAPLPCEMITVKFLSMKVFNDGDSGSGGDWDMFFRVNGVMESLSFGEDAINDNANTPIGLGVSINVPIDGYTNSVHLSCDVVERDHGSIFNGSNDVGPTTQTSFTRAELFGIGNTFDLSGSTGDIAYSLTVSISCAQISQRVLPRRAIINAVNSRQKLQQQKNWPKTATEKTETQIVNRFIRALNKHHWKITKITKDEVLVEGPGDPYILRNL